MVDSPGPGFGQRGAVGNPNACRQGKGLCSRLVWGSEVGAAEGSGTRSTAY